MSRDKRRTVIGAICLALASFATVQALAASASGVLPVEARAAISKVIRAERATSVARENGGSSRIPSATRLTASDVTVNDGFGCPVSISGDTVVVGSFAATVGPNSFQGAVYVFVRPPGGWTTTSTFDAKLTASDGAAGDWFGTSVAISGDTVVVGAPNAQIGSSYEQGAAYVFVKPTGGWSTTSVFDAKLTAVSGAAFEYFGDSVAISGDTVVSGAFASKIGLNAWQGAAYVFVKPPGGWVTTSTFDARLTSSDGATWDTLGASVAVSGDTVVAGAPFATVNSNYEQGAAYVFVKPPGGWVTTSTFDAKLTSPDGAANDNFASPIAISDDTVVGGATGAMIGSNPHQGAAYVFVEPRGGWAAQQPPAVARLTVWDGETYDSFSDSVAISLDAIVAGAPRARVGENLQQGATYVFRRPPAGWATTSSFDRKLTAPDGKPGDAFGASVAISADQIVAGLPADTKLPGSPGLDPPPPPDPRLGAAYLFGPCEAMGTGPCLDALPPTQPAPVGGRKP